MHVTDRDEVFDVSLQVSSSYSGSTSYKLATDMLKLLSFDFQVFAHVLRNAFSLPRFLFVFDQAFISDQVCCHG